MVRSAPVACLPVAVQAGASHQAVTIAVIGINVGLASVAWAVWRWPEALVVGAGGVVALLGVGWVFVVRGKAERDRVVSQQG